MRVLNSAETLDLGSNEIAEMKSKTNKVVKMVLSHVSPSEVEKLGCYFGFKSYEVGQMTWKILGHKNRTEGRSLNASCSYTSDKSGSYEYSTVEAGMEPHSTMDVWNSLPGFIDWMYVIFPELRSSMRPYWYAAQIALSKEVQA